MYMDDKALNLDDNPIKAASEYEQIEKWMLKYGMPFNRKKCVLLSNEEEISKTFKEKFNINTEEKEKYLGVTLKLNEDSNLESDVRYFELGEKIFSLPKFQSFMVKKTCFKGALFAKLRFRMMMLTPTRIIEKGKIVKIIRGAHARDFSVLSFVELLHFSPNLAQIFIDLTNMKNWKDEIGKLTDQEERKSKLNQKIKEIMLCGVKQLDERLKNIDVDLDINELEIDLNDLKMLVKRTWRCYKEEITRNWMNEKENEGINYPRKLLTWLNNKLVTNCKVLLNIVFRHLDLTKVNITGFVIQIIKQIREKLEKEEDLQNFQSNNKVFFMLNAPKQKLKEDLKAKEFVYKELDKDLNEILTTSRKDKSRYKQLLWAFTIVDQIIESKVWNEESINSMIEAYNYKLMDMGEEQKMFLKIMKQEMEEDEEDEITYKEANQEEKSITIGVARIGEEIIGSLGITEKSKYQKLEQNLCFKIDKEKDIQKAKLACAIKALQWAKEKKWDQINIKTDYLGTRNYSNFEWAMNDEKVRQYNYYSRKLIKEGKLKVNWTIVKKEGIQDIIKQNMIAGEYEKNVKTSLTVNIFSWDNICK